MDTTCFLELELLAWQPFSVSGTTPILVIDSHRAHISQKATAALNETGALVKIIPGGYTSTLQPLDVGVNKPFRVHLTDAFEAHMRRGAAPITRGIVARWVLQAFTNVSQATITNSWRHIGLTV